MIYLDGISFKQFLEIKQQMDDNIKKIFKDHSEVTGQKVLRLWNLPDSPYWRKMGEEYLQSGEIDESNFKTHWFPCRIIRQWNTEAYGKSFESLYRAYKSIANDPKHIEILKKIREKANIWGFILNETATAAEEGRFLSFWAYRVAYEDTKGAWRHWYDSFLHDNKFNIGSIVEFRSRATHNHLWHTEVVWDRPRLRTTSYHDWKKIKNKTFIVLAYDQKKPPTTYSYKPSMGSHKMVTVLPLGETKVHYVSEQFLKISRKQAIKDAKRGNK